RGPGTRCEMPRRFPFDLRPRTLARLRESRAAHTRRRTPRRLRPNCRGPRLPRRSAGQALCSTLYSLVEPQVRLDPVASALAAEAGLLVAAERRGRVEAVERVRPDHPGTETLRHPEDPRALL